MFPTVEEIGKARKVYNGKMFKSSIQTFGRLGELEEEALRDGALKGKYKELVAPGISIGNACYG